MTEHSILPPSSAARRVACPGSRKLEALYPRQQTESAREGELAHHYAAMHLKYNMDIKNGIFDGKEPDSIPSYLKDGVNMYLDYVCFQMLNRTGKIHIEERLNMPSIHAECWGTPDAWFIENRVLHIFDFKYGFSPIEAFENWQMIEYAAGVPSEFTKAIFHIVQPRASHPDGPIRIWSVDMQDLVEYWDMLIRIEWEAMQANPITKPSTQCVNCNARHACPALQKTVLDNINTLNATTPHDLDEAGLGNELRILHNAAKLLDARITGLEQEALAKLKSGKRIPHYELGEVQSLERWVKDEKEITALGELFDIELRKPIEVKFITPKQAIKAGIPAKVVRNYSETPKGAKKLQAIDEKKIRKMFS